MANKPWKGAIKKPSRPQAVDKTPPDVSLEIEYVYGYRCHDVRQNIYYTATGEIVFMAAALGIV